MKPTWAGWPEVIAAQNADVESHSACLWVAQWNEVDDVDWVPEITDVGIQWDTCTPNVYADATFGFKTKIKADHRDLWNPVGQENTIWYPVDYPN